MVDQEAKEFLKSLGCDPAQIDAIQAYYDVQIHLRAMGLLLWPGLALAGCLFLGLLFLSM